MTLAEIAVRLAALHDSPGYRATRFDDGPPFTGRVAVLPSAFNPPTMAHAALLDLGRTVEGVTASAALLTTNNVDKSIFGAPLAHRVGMLLALRQAHGCAVLASNAARLVDQGEALMLTFPDVAFDFLVGFDTLVRVFDAKYYEDMPATLARFFDAHRLIATNRAQATIETVQAYLEQPLVRDYAARIVVRELDERRAHVSSTEARRAVTRGAPPPALAPEVAAYIHAHGLYGDSD